jgi:hypothetical protein
MAIPAWLTVVSSGLHRPRPAVGGTHPQRYLPAGLREHVKTMKAATRRLRRKILRSPWRPPGGAVPYCTGQ